tara:strand:+ start:456 stop:707 length:252 start_codon:yes stop_codon:yes gene_type:complete
LTLLSLFENGAIKARRRRERTKERGDAVKEWKEGRGGGTRTSGSPTPTCTPSSTRNTNGCVSTLFTRPASSYYERYYKCNKME